MSVLEFAVKFFQDSGVAIYFSITIMAVGLAIAIERWVFLQPGPRREPQAVGEGAAAAAERQVQGGAQRRLRLRRRDRQDRRQRPGAHAEPGAPRGHRQRDGGGHDGNRAAPGEAHALHRHAGQRDHAGRPAGHHHRPDQGLHRGGRGQPGREGRAAVGLDLDRDEQHRLRAVGGHPLPAHPRLPAGAHQRDRRRPGGREDQLPEPGAAHQVRTAPPRAKSRSRATSPAMRPTPAQARGEPRGHRVHQRHRGAGAVPPVDGGVHAPVGDRAVAAGAELRRRAAQGRRPQARGRDPPRRAGRG